MSNNGSPYGAAFMIRMCILLGIFVLAVGGFYYDRQVLIPRADKKIEEVQKLITARTDDGGGIPQSQVDEAIGNTATKVSREHVTKPADPDKTENFKAKTYEVVTYKFKRVLPFLLKPHILEVAYQDKAVVFSSPGKPIEEELLDSGFESKFVRVAPTKDMMPAVGGMGGGTPRGDGGGDDDSDKDEEGSDEKADDKNESESSDEKETSEGEGDQ